MNHTYDDIHRLVLKMREGSQDAQRELIEAHVGLAFKASMDLDDEALSDALLTLVQEVEVFRTSEHHPASLPSYLKTALGRAAIRKRRSKSGKRDSKFGRACHTATNDAKRFIHSGRSLPEVQDTVLIDMMDQVLAVCESEQERQMVYYKSLNMTYAEVALRVGTSTTCVANSIQRLSLRFKVQERLRA